eukprot:scaffold648951_cov46-Prasinocladus_malaysianus.AAC.1
MGGLVKSTEPSLSVRQTAGLPMAVVASHLPSGEKAMSPECWTVVVVWLTIVSNSSPHKVKPSVKPNASQT